jgi:hypothetical protein
VIVVVLLIVIVIGSVAGLVLFSKPSPTRSSTTIVVQPSTTTSNLVSPPTTTSVITTSYFSSNSIATVQKTNVTAAVLSQLDGLVQDLNTRDIDALANYYTSTSVVNWTGHVQGLGGVYNGVSNILILYISSLAHTQNLVANYSGLRLIFTRSDNASVIFRLSLEGFSTVLGNLSAKVNVSQIWIESTGVWTIQNETWDYITFVTTNPSTSTVFPQWGLTLAGKSPDLASEHVLEWDAAPYVAAGIYASILCMFVASIVVRQRKKMRRPV